MKWHSLVLITFSSSLSATDRVVTLHTDAPAQRIVTLHVPQSMQKHSSTHRCCRDPKAYKRAFLKHKPDSVRALAESGYPNTIPDKQIKAVLAIIARTQNSQTRKKLFNAGLKANLYTCAMARKSANAMKRHAQQLKHLARQHKSHN